MTNKTLLRQVQDLKAQLPPPNDGGERIAILYPNAWPADTWAAYQMAGDTGDAERQYQLIEQVTGTRPSRMAEPLVIIIGERTDGPQ